MKRNQSDITETSISNQEYDYHSHKSIHIKNRQSDLQPSEGLPPSASLIDGGRFTTTYAIRTYGDLGDERPVSEVDIFEWANICRRMVMSMILAGPTVASK